MNEMNIGVTLSNPQVNPLKAQASYTLLAGSTCGKCYLSADGDIILPEGGSPVQLHFRLTQTDLRIGAGVYKLDLQQDAFAIKSGSANQFSRPIPEIGKGHIKLDATNADAMQHEYVMMVTAKSGAQTLKLSLDPKIKNGGTTLRDDGCTFSRDDLMGLALVLTSALALVAMLGCAYFVRNWSKNA